LCPEEISYENYKNSIEKVFNQNELNLFHHWYKQQEEILDVQQQQQQQQQDYNNNISTDLNFYLDLDFFDASNSNYILANESGLDKLKEIFIDKLELSDPSIVLLTSSNNEYDLYDNEMSEELKKKMALKLKYLKTIQQEEIELIMDHADPTTIVWFELSSTPKQRTSTIDTFHYLRFQIVLNALQSKVLAHNYKQCTIDSTTNNNTGTNLLTEIEKTMNNFVYQSIQCLVDNYLKELYAYQSRYIAIKIDKQLAHEIGRHFEIYRMLKKYNAFNNLIVASAEAQAKYQKHQILFNAKMRAYNDDKTDKSICPLIFYNINDQQCISHNDEWCSTTCSSDVMIAKWIDWRSRDVDLSSPSPSLKNEMINDRSEVSVVYRFCGRTILSSQIATLLQSIIHQLCYLMEIHESWSFESPQIIIKNLIKSLAHYKTKMIDNNIKSKFIIILDRIDRLCTTRYDLSLLNSFMKAIFFYDSNNKEKSNETSGLTIKLILTYSLPKESITIHLQQIKKLFKNVDNFSHCLNAPQHHSPTKSKKQSLVNSYSNTSSNRVLRSTSSSLTIHQQTPIEVVKSQLNSLLNSTGSKKVSSANSLVDTLFVILTNCRYGLKQCEIIEIMHKYLKKNDSNSSNCKHF
jgi:Ni,Fe-hydrogenase maturation factor